MDVSRNSEIELNSYDLLEYIYLSLAWTDDMLQDICGMLWC